MKPIKSLYQNENYPHSQCSKDRSNVFLLEALNFFLTIPCLTPASKSCFMLPLETKIIGHDSHKIPLSIKKTIGRGFSAEHVRK